MTRTIVIVAAAGSLLFSCVSGGGDAAEYVEALSGPLTVAGFATPEAILHDTEADVYLVSNINGNPSGVDDNGFVSRVSPSGEILELKWIDGESDAVTLSAPKGMAIVGDRLYVTDITSVQVFNRATGEQVGTIPVEGSTFLNDLAAGEDGALYLTDSGFDAQFAPTGADAVYHLEGDAFAALITGAELARPNGVEATPSGPLVISFGSTEMYGVADGAKFNIVNLPTGRLDGIVAHPGGFYVSSWDGSSILSGTRDGEFEVVLSDVPAPADIEYDARRNRLLIPLFQNNEIRIVPMGS